MAKSYKAFLTPSAPSWWTRPLWFVCGFPTNSLIKPWFIRHGRSPSRPEAAIADQALRQLMPAGARRDQRRPWRPQEARFGVPRRLAVPVAAAMPRASPSCGAGKSETMTATGPAGAGSRTCDPTAASAPRGRASHCAAASHLLPPPRRSAASWPALRRRQLTACLTWPAGGCAGGARLRLPAGDGAVTGKRRREPRRGPGPGRGAERGKEEGLGRDAPRPERLAERSGLPRRRAALGLAWRAASAGPAGTAGARPPPRLSGARAGGSVAAVEILSSGGGWRESAVPGGGAGGCRGSWCLPGLPGRSSNPRDPDQRLWGEQSQLPPPGVPASQPQVAPARGMRAPRCEIFPGVALASSLWPLLPVKRGGSEGQTPSVRSGFWERAWRNDVLGTLCWISGDFWVTLVNRAFLLSETGKKKQLSPPP